MIHKCSIAVNGCKDSPTCKCKRGYENTAIQDKTSFDERGFPEYRRDFQCDLDVVPHSRSLILDWDGHANTEYAGNTQCVLYLYKYLYKGAKKVKLRLTNAENVPDDDEVTLYLRGRFLCAMDAMWRTLGYQTYPASFPAVQTITVKMPETVQYLLNDRKSCDMLVYFNRPMQLIHLKYTELFGTYVVQEKLSRRFNHEDMDNLNGYFIITIPLLRRDLYLQRRSDSSTTIIRMEMLYITAGHVFTFLNSSICFIKIIRSTYTLQGEIWYLRLLLLHTAPSSYVNARTVNGIVHDTFQRAALELNLVTDVTDALVCFQQSLGMATPYELRCLFVSLTIAGYPTLPIYNNDDLRRELMLDWLSTE